MAVSERARRPTGGVLFVVATPIGNLEDITLRALRVLREVDLVAAEDTRRTGNLLRHYQIGTPLLSVRAHNERERAGEIVARLARGASIALVTDAGTPAVSDPGAVVVAAVRDAGFRVEPVPGPSAIMAALSAAGLREPVAFAFLGFPPSRGNDRTKWFGRLAALEDMVAVFFEAPHRLAATVESLQTILGERPMFVARELTKLYEETRWGVPADFLEEARHPKGEYTLLVMPAQSIDKTTDPPTDAQIADEFGRTAESAGGSRRAKARSVAEKLGLTTRQVYDALERSKK